MRRSHLLLFVVLLILDIAYSFKQHYHNVLDGDMPGIILPAEWYADVLEDPFALSVLKDGEIYAAPNRFFCHWPMSVYFKTMPQFLQNFTTPINSVYLGCALIKIIAQVLLIYLLAYFISGNKKINNQYFLISAILITPFFQTYGYFTATGLIQQSPTFFFFYSLPFILLLFFFLPFYRYLFLREKIKLNAIQKVILILLCISLPLSSPLIAPLALIACPIIIAKEFIYYFQKNKSQTLFKKSFKSLQLLPFPLLFYFTLISLFSLYSIYIGTFNLEDGSSDITLLERYSHIPKGFAFMYISKPFFPIIAATLLINFLIIKKTNREALKKYKTYLKWSVIFLLIYVLILPLGGYRTYRPDVLRHDLMIPATVVFLFLFGWSTLVVLKGLKPKIKLNLYTAFISSILLFFTISDDPGFDKNKCQRETFEKISKSKEDVVEIKERCDLLHWGPIKYPESSQYSSRLLKLWNITDNEKVYVQEVKK